jgi:hypothetical protein
MMLRIICIHLPEDHNMNLVRLRYRAVDWINLAHIGHNGGIL